MTSGIWCLVIALIAVLSYAVYWWTSQAVVRPASKPAPAKAQPESASPLAKLSFDEDDDVDPTRIGAGSKRSAPAVRIVYDEDGADDVPTQSRPLILVSASAQSDTGLRRKRNEDSLLLLDEHGVFIVADGMGGHAGGGLASSLAVKTIGDAFTTQTFDGPAHPNIPQRASELARAIQMANEAILQRAGAERELEGMGTTICAARFSSNKQRLYVGHVGDSRAYCLRDGHLRQMTSDHTMMSDFGLEGAVAGHLSRAVGVWPVVPVDIVLGKPQPGDRYLICSDGLTKMMDDGEIERILEENAPQAAAEKLVSAANEQGGKDNITVVVLSVTAAS